MTCLSPGWMMLMCLNDMPAPRTALVSLAVVAAGVVI